jgi:hypothetical protein
VDRAVLLSHLETAESYVAKGDQYIGRLRELIGVLARSGTGATEAEALLRQVESVQEMYVSHRDWLLNELKHSTGITHQDSDLKVREFTHRRADP